MAMASFFGSMLLLLSSCLGAFFWHIRRRKRDYSVGFFHPYTNDGGGGERVLWCAVRALQEQDPRLFCVVYTGDEATSETLADRSLRLFGVKLHSPPKVVRLQKRFWVESTTYPHFTVFGQSIGSIVLGMEALMKFTPSIFFDTAGYAFTYPLARAFGCKVVCYTHYPAVSSDMFARVLGRSALYNNNIVIARSFVLSLVKAIYYLLLTLLYGLVGRCAHLAMVNSSWTQAHIEKLWRISDKVVRVYPPCDTQTLQAQPLERNSSDIFFISVAQFRPEKAHEMQLEAFAKVIKDIHMDEYFERNQIDAVQLKLVGSCRHKEDADRVENLRLKCKNLGIEEHVEFLINVSYTYGIWELVQLLGGAIAGLHAMIDEHFGIVVVEYMAAGAIPIAHNSAGPKMDIVVDEDGEKTGFLAASVEEFADAMRTVLKMPKEKRLQMAMLARRKAGNFSVERFDHSFKLAMSSILR